MLISLQSSGPTFIVKSQMAITRKRSWYRLPVSYHPVITARRYA